MAETFTEMVRGCLDSFEDGTLMVEHNGVPRPIAELPVAKQWAALKRIMSKKIEASGSTQKGD